MAEMICIKVGMADLNVAEAGNTLRTTGLGSCVGVALFDPNAQIAGLAHVMLPTSSIAREESFNLAKYADTAIPLLIERMHALGAKQERLKAKLAGGAQMFALASKGDTLRIGPRNVESCTEMLSKFHIPVLAQDTGGSVGRTIELSSSNGVLSVRSVQFGIKEI